ncbi:glycosyltransferase family 9 protein [Verrucomicrobiaceae bacterium 227]
MMPKMQQAATQTLQLTGEYLAIASPSTIVEACLSVPAVRALRKAQPNRTIVVLANQETAPIWKVVSDIDFLIRYKASDSSRRLASLLEESDLPYNSSISWEEGPAAAAFAKFKIPQRLGPSNPKLNRHLTNPVVVIRDPGPIEHHVNHYLHFVKELAIDPLQAEYFAPPKRPEITAETPIAIVPGSDFGPAAEWSHANFAKLCEQLQQLHPLVILPSQMNPAPAQALARALGNMSLVSPANGLDRIRLIRKSRLLIGSDGSLPHLASLVGTPSLVIFGPNEPVWKRPLGRIHETVRCHVPCSPCFLTKCPLDHRCMWEIPIDLVLEKATAMLTRITKDL